MVKYGGLVERIEQLLRDYGPMTRSELCDHMKRDRREIASVVSRMARPTKTLPKRLYISGYVYDHDYGRRYPRAVYSLGDKPNVKAPGPQSDANKKRYNKGRRLRMTGNSVFNWGLPRRVYTKKPTGEPIENNATSPS